MTPPDATRASSLAFRRRLVTPEGLDLRLVLASAGERATAFLIDLVIIGLAVVALDILAAAAASGLGEDARDPVGIVSLLGGFILTNGYFLFFEAGPRGATPGKRRLGLRVVARDGGRLTFEAILTRNALRELEVFLPLTVLVGMGMAGDTVDALMVDLAVVWTGLFLVFPLLNRDRLRVGDLLAGSWVVRAPRTVLLADLAGDAVQALSKFAFTADQTDAYGVKELEILEAVLRRRDPKAVRAVADRIRGKIGFHQPPNETDATFLTAYYAALRARLEHRLLFGHRRRDKFDKA